MDKIEKQTLTNINKIPIFNESIKKLTTNSELPKSEIVYLLGCAIIFLRFFQKDNRYTSYAEFSYYIVLKYSLLFRDYLPLYDFSTSFGFYPISKNILDNQLLASQSISDCFLNIELDRFKVDRYFETLHQYIEKKNLLSDTANEVSYIAPTSFGKSSVIVDIIKKYSKENLKIVIVVPTKSLLMQTYRMIREASLNRKIIIHDEMYQNESSFIAVFTQERALRLLKKHPIHFDILFIDEAHNILNNDPRSILLSRLIAKNRLLNPPHKIVYLSPLVDKVNNLKIVNEQIITEHKIPFNVKEPDIFEMRLSGEIYQYNRFVGEHYKTGEAHSLFSYIIEKASAKNFIYNYRPINIELLAKNLSNFIGKIPITERLQELIRILKQEVHEKFYAIEYIAHGIIYLHGKLPDLVKEYLESKFRDLPEIKFIIANSVILEGMNLPIDNLYILNTYGLSGKELTNLIGRVNRLNTIFTSGANNLHKLIPKVHFLNSNEYNRQGSNMTLKIELLRSRIFNDEIENPTLDSFDFEKFNTKNELENKAKQKCQLIQKNEKFLNKIPINSTEKLKQYLIESGISAFYNDIDAVTTVLENKIPEIGIRQDWNSLDMMGKINDLFILNINSISDFEFSRLSLLAARNYYEFHITVSQKNALKVNIIHMFEHFKKRVADKNSKTYFGETYGEEPREVIPNQFQRKDYIDLSNKTDVELINLAIVKLKMEDDFVSFKLNKLIIMMRDYELISIDDYNKYIYGTMDKRKIELTKIGLSVSLISRLEEDNQLQFLYFDPYNNLKARGEFDNYKAAANDFYRFEIERFLN